MKSRETKQKDLVALTESLQNSKSAMVVSFTKLTVTKDQEFRNSLREAGANYQVVKNTLARIAVKGTQFEDATEHFKGVTAIAWTDNDPVVLSKAISKFMKDNAEYLHVQDRCRRRQAGRSHAVDDDRQSAVERRAYFEASVRAQQLGSSGIVTVINAVPRDLAVVIKQIGEQNRQRHRRRRGEGRRAGTRGSRLPKRQQPAEAEVIDEAPAEAAPAVEEARGSSGRGS